LGGASISSQFANGKIHYNQIYVKKENKKPSNMHSSTITKQKIPKPCPMSIYFYTNIFHMYIFTQNTIKFHIFAKPTRDYAINYSLDH
jgi:hypothetical protein